jgi:hypothetical protein
MNLSTFATKNNRSSLLFATIGFSIAALIGLLAGWVFLKGNLAEAILDIVVSYQVLQRLLLALALFGIGLALSGVVVGGIGGWVLSMIDPLASRRRYIWSGAIAYAISQVIVISLALLLSTFIALYNNNIDTKPTNLPLLFAIFGLFYGMFSGLLLGFLSVGFKYGWSVLLVSMLSSLVGGALVGVVLTFVANTTANNGSVSFIWVVILITVLFFGINGAALGWLYARFGNKREKNGSLPAKMGWFWRIAGVVAGVILLANLAGTFGTLFSFAKIVPASSAKIIAPKTIGVAWSRITNIPGSKQFSSPVIDMATNADGELALVWSKSAGEITDITMSLQKEGNTRRDDWDSSLNVSDDPAISVHPSVAADADGNWHIVWAEADAGDEVNMQIMYAICKNENCTEPVSLSQNLPDCKSDAQGQDFPVIAINNTGQVMTVWQTGDSSLLFATWQTPNTSSPTNTGCIPTAGLAQNPRLVSNSNGEFLLAFDSLQNEKSSEVSWLQYTEAGWSSTPLMSDGGHDPELYDDKTGKVHTAWCGDDDHLHYVSLSTEQNTQEIVDFPKCEGRPAIAEDGYGRLHLIWQADEIKNNLGIVSNGDFLYESIRLDEGWSEPVIVAENDKFLFPVATVDKADMLYLAWSSESAGIRYVEQPFYTCDESTGLYLADAVLSVLTSGEYRPEDAMVPFCQNKFEKLLYLPSADLDLETENPNDYGGFEDIDKILIPAKYEALFATMEWMQDENMDSPGFVLAEAVTRLYDRLKKHPEDYPRGITLRILLGNYPEIATFTWGDQIWYVMDDLKKAGLPEMENPEIGWKLEVANYDGQMPHSHTKFLVVDGSKVTGAGFNYSYLHLSKKHPSGLGEDLLDLGMEVKGPVAQQALADYDDLWSDSNKVECPDLNPPNGDWEKYCHFTKAKAEHVPEVLLYHPMSENDIAFSLLRTPKRPESDKAIEALIRSTKDTLDIFEVNFSLKAQCAIGAVMDGFCTFDDALPYMQALLDAIEKNGVKIRVLVTDVNMNGIENSVAIKVFMEELAKRGLDDQAEFRYYTGRMHTKAFLADEKLLVVGSQNFHYSAWGDGKGLAEYNVVTDNPEAIVEFKNLFEYRWEQSVPVEDASGLRKQN